MITISAITGISAGVVGACAYFAPQVLRVRDERALRQRCARSRSLVLSYDDGPGAELTPRLLDVLAGESARATFFLLGVRVAKNPELVDRIVEGGHEVGCHSQQHLNAWTTWPWKAVADIDAGYRTLSRWIFDDALFRPAYGKLSFATWLVVRRRGAAIGWWTIDSGDTHSVEPSPQQAIDQLKRDGGGVVLLHDFDRSPKRAAFVLQTTELLLRTAKREGLMVRRLGDVFADSGRCVAASRPPGTGVAR
ncbi:MAG: polysaccharide deacetylase family protein [Planctomycetes bacterium]|nr:polysaccharide deacetylase family protein [Planctomycetota bacterium]MBI3843456.1 polysaccharide deacetylase family protein [Planctomycetota bacterium]